MDACQDLGLAGLRKGWATDGAVPRQAIAHARGAIVVARRRLPREALAVVVVCRAAVIGMPRLEAARSVGAAGSSTRPGRK
eukprot:1104111-Alexandrium_andersonii.AAC.1